MRPISIALSLLAGLLAGWFLVPAGGRSSPPREAAIPSLPPPAAPEAEVASPAPAQAPVSIAPGDAAAPATSPADGLAALLARFPAREYPTGPGVLSGTVVRHDDETPIAGIAIDAVIHGLTPGAEAKGIEQPELLGFILEEIEQFHYDAGVARRAVTDEEGRFRVDGLLPDEKYHLTPAPSEEWFVFSMKPPVQLSPGSEVEFRAAPLAHIEVEVVDGGGAPIPLGWVELRDPEQPNGLWFRDRFTPRDREVRVPLPYTSITALLDDGRRSDPVELALAPGERAPARLVVRTRSGFEFTVHAAEPIDLAGLSVRVVPDDGKPLPEDRQELRWAEGTTGSDIDPVTGEGECFAEPGRYHLLLLRDEVEIELRAVELREERLAVDFSPPPRDRSSIAIVEVLDPEGNPAEPIDFEVSSHLRSADGDEHRTGGQCESVSLGEGRHAVVDGLGSMKRWGKELTVVSTELRCRSPLYGTIARSISFGSGEVQELRFVDPATLVVDLLGYVGGDLQGRVTVRLASAEGEESSEAYGTIDPLGRVTFPPVSPGASHVRVTTERGWDTAIVESDITLAAGENALAFELPELHSITARFPPGSRGRSAMLLGHDGNFVGDEEVGEDLQVEFHDLLPGRYRLGTGVDWMDVRVPQGGVIDYRPVVANALAVTIDDAEGWLARAGFRDGDRIIGIDGELYAGVRTLQFALMRAISAKAGEVIIEREGAEMRLPIPVEPPPNVYEIGGELEPAVRGGGE